MKLAKKIMVAAVALAAFGLVGCKMNIGDNDIIEANTAGAEVNFTNDSDGVMRHLRTLKLKHSGASCKITAKRNDGKQADGNGMMGIAFNVTQNKDTKLYSFYVFGSTVNKNGDVKGYLSYFANIDEAALDSKNFGASVTASTKAAADANMADGKPVATECEIWKLGSMPELKGCVNGDEYSINVAFYPEQTGGTFTGKYTFAVYEGDAKLSYNKETGEISASEAKTSVKKIAGLDVFTWADGTSDDDKKNLKKVPQWDIAYYVNVYAGETLTGTWNMPKDNVINAEVTKD